MKIKALIQKILGTLFALFTFGAVTVVWDWTWIDLYITKFDGSFNCIVFGGLFTLFLVAVVSLPLLATGFIFLADLWIKD